MDPQRSLGFANSLLSFIVSLTKLLGSDEELRNGPPRSPNGTMVPGPGITLGDIYEAFINNNVNLFDPDLTTPGHGMEELRDPVWALNDVAAVCREDFERLKTLLEQVRQSNSDETRWPDFRQTLQSHWYPNEVSAFEQRCSESWELLTKHVCSITEFWRKRYQEGYVVLRKARLKQLDEIPQHFHYQVENAPLATHMFRLLGDLCTRLQKAKLRGQISLGDMNFWRNRFNALVPAEKAVRGENIIIGTLLSDGHDVQIKAIPDAVEPMFNWVFSSRDSPDSPQSSGSLKNWLRHGYGIGLVIGESGCGKSMLMKHMSRHQDLIGTLYQWSSPRSTVVASHFFSRTGTVLQRSRKGMLQTLLRGLLLQLPCENNAIYRKQRPSHPQKLRDLEWTVEELEELIVHILQSHDDVMFCFFIDGVDEYEGDVRDLAACLQRLMAGNGKICLSSTGDEIGRYFRVRVEKFAVGGSFLRHDLEVFLAKRLESHPLYVHASEEERTEVARITADKYRNFLWGRIAIEQLRSQYRTQHTVQDVKRLLDELPSHPLALVKHCLRATPASLAPFGAYFFLVTLAAKDPPPLAIYHFLATEQQDPDYATKLEAKVLDQEEMRKSTREALEKRCGGFLAIRSDFRVAFPHGVLSDTFRSPDIVAALRATASTKKNVHLSLAKAYLAYMKTTKLSWGRPTFATTWLKLPSYATAFAEFVELTRVCEPSRAFPLLDNWERHLLSKSQIDQQQLAVEDRINVNPSQHFRGPLLSVLFRSYIGHKLRRHPNWLDSLRDKDNGVGPPALSLTLASMFEVPPERREDHVKMINCLLQYGANPNKTYQIGRPTYTPWTVFIRAALRPAELKWSLHSGLFSEFLDNRADPNAPVWEMLPRIFGDEPRKFTCAWVVVVCTISEVLQSKKVEFSEADERAINTVLEGFCAAGASAQDQLASNFFNSPEPSKDPRWVEAIFANILESGTPHSPVSNIQAALVECVACILVQSNLSAEGFWDLLQSHWPADAVQRLRIRVREQQRVLEKGDNGTSSTSESPSASSGKRSGDEMITDSETSSKRARSETEDESIMTMTMRAEARSI